MGQGRYLNIILTVNALLLTVLVWTQLAGHGPLVQRADAQSAGGGSMVSAAEQRQRMIESMRDMRQAVNETNRLLERGTLKVTVMNAHELRSESQGNRESLTSGN